jgi:HAD superfamily hydrolase (TIGR01458 family)
MIRAVLLDLAGVVYQGEQPLPGAVAAVGALRATELRLRFLTNTTRMPRRMLLRRLAEMGVGIEEEELFTPAQAASAWLRARKFSAYLLVHPALAEDLEGLNGTRGEAVVVGDAGEAFTYAALNTAFRKLIAGAAFLALARNRTFKDGEGELSLDAGAFVTALEYSSRREAILLGKPAPDFFRAALAGTACGVEEAVMIGDDAEADVAGALAAGIGSALLVRTGKYRAGDEDGVHPAPTATLDDLAAAARWILERR